ncbi:glycerate kinase family protein [Pontibacillus litoralis]|uniref:Glycerate kinase n=1 Tax=Pontibacillus litoralis JSM 072002 TaxID=1385512 RepID=A0A0A5G8B9_9BACI|nr:glycerate kinase [Pontibacillus litoralis]KGX87365.1 glycerate kinase [Pontibacillus litoralis JSM 072002]
MKIVLVPSGFKECIDAEKVGLAMERGAKKFDDRNEIEMIPMVDGGEGFAKTITKTKEGEMIYGDVRGPVGDPVTAHIGIYVENGERIAVIEMAAAAGLKLVPLNQRNPLKTTTHGVGELILCALDYDVDRILIGCGDSGTSDGGAGMAEALGVRFMDDLNHTVKINGVEDIIKVRHIDMSQLDPRIADVVIDVACNWTNVLCGEKGVARVFGPQKGATPQQVDLLSAALEHFANLIEKAFSIDMRLTPGSGASGGLGTGLVAFAKATLHPRFDVIKRYIQMEQKIKEADIVFTAEGSIDFQTPNGKIPTEVARIAKKYDKPVVAITGTIGKGAKLNYEVGIDAFISIIPKPTSLQKAMEHASKWIEGSMESVLRQVTIGYQMAKRKPDDEKVS